MNEIKIFAFADEASPNIDGQIKALKRNGLNGIEIRNVDGENVSDITVSKAKEVRRRLVENGLTTWSVGSPVGKISINDGFGAHLDRFRHTLEVADALGAQNIRIFSFYIPDGKAPADCKNEVIDRMGRLAEAARGSNIRLCHENEKGIYGDTPERCLEIFTAVPEIKGVFDPANFVQCGVDTASAWDILKQYIYYMHIKDALKGGAVVPAGRGDGNIKSIAADFVARGGRCFTIEPHLTVFDGLSRLERKGERSEIADNGYPDADTAFDAACAAFKSLL
jgi:sugar phosphate isomerase/epimerase